MPKITSIEPQKNKKRLNIFLDGEFGFGVDLETYIKSGLKVGRELTEDEVKKVIRQSELATVYGKLVLFASLRPRSGKEFNDWLGKYKVDKSLYTELFNRLKRLELMDDTKFAKWWVDQRKHFKSKSKKELLFELRSKGIAPDVIQEILSGREDDDIKSALGLLKKKDYLWKAKSAKEARKKKTEFLLRHGFAWNVINKVVKGLDVDD